VSRAPRPAALLVGALLLPLALSGCAAGRKSETYQERTVADATNDAVGSIALRNVFLAPPPDGEQWTAGSAVPGTMTLVNQGQQADELTSVTTDAGTVQLVKGTPPATQPAGTVPVPALLPADPAYSFVLQGLSRPLRAGDFVSLTFAFKSNGSASVLVPVSTGESAAPRNTQRPEKEVTGDSG
jgi:copper(I)-binding protein